jgi:hypothetical protein
VTTVRRRFTRSAGAFGLALGGAACLGACYTFAPVAPSALPAGGEVRVTLTAGGTAALAPALGNGVDGVEGSLVRQTRDTLVVHPTTLNATGGVDVDWTGSDVAIPLGWTSKVERRRVSVGRTALFVVGGVAAAAIIVDLAHNGGRGGDIGSSGPPNLGRGVR